VSTEGSIPRGKSSATPGAGSRVLEGVFFLSLSFLSGCWACGPKPVPAAKPVEGLPDEIPELMEIAEESSRDDAQIGQLNRAVSALEKALVLSVGAPSEVALYELQWRLARACFLAAEIEGDPGAKLGWITRGETAAAAASRERPDRVEGYYYQAVLKGRRAEASGLGFSAMVLARRVEKLGLKAVEIDPTFDNASPYRVLAMLYANAPPWPTSIGDIDDALEYAEKAVETSDYPMNHLIMAEVLIEADELVEARLELKKVLAAPKVGKWAYEGERWRPRAMALLKKIETAE